MPKRPRSEGVPPQEPPKVDVPLQEQAQPSKELGVPWEQIREQFFTSIEAATTARNLLDIFYAALKGKRLLDLGYVLALSGGGNEARKSVHNLWYEIEEKVMRKLDQFPDDSDKEHLIGFHHSLVENRTGIDDEEIWQPVAHMDKAVVMELNRMAPDTLHTIGSDGYILARGRKWLYGMEAGTMQALVDQNVANPWEWNPEANPSLGGFKCKIKGPDGSDHTVVMPEDLQQEARDILGDPRRETRRTDPQAARELLERKVQYE